MISAYQTAHDSRGSQDFRSCRDGCVGGTIDSCAERGVSFPLSWPWWLALALCIRPPGLPLPPGNSVHDPLTAELGQ